MKKVLIACEESQVVCKEFRKLGFEAYSCDTEPCSGGHPEWHIQDNVEKHLDKEWDIIIAFPPCTDLSAAGGHLWKQKQEDGRQQKAFEFIKKIWDSNCEFICIENPVGWLNRNWRKPAQTIHPYMFGHPFMKRTCLWLKGLPELEYTKIVKPESYWINATNSSRPGAKLGNNGKHRDPKERSKTFPGIAAAMAQQWSKVILGESKRTLNRFI